MQLKTILNHLQKQPGFVYGQPRLIRRGTSTRIDVPIRARRGSRAVCSGCGKKRPAYDRLDERRFEFVPLWAIPVFFVYRPRRCDCSRCGVKVELLPWADGKSPVTITFAWFLANWAKVLSWSEVARRFRVSWHVVFSAVRMAVEWGRTHQALDGIRSIGVDEFAWKKGHKYLTMVYQIDRGATRLLWIGKDRTAATFEQFFGWLGKERSARLHFVASDMWKAFLGVVARRASNCVHVLDRYHVAQMFSKAIDKVRRSEVRLLKERGRAPILTKTRWIWLKRQHRLSEVQRGHLDQLLRANLRTVRAYLLKEDFLRFWGYVSPHWASRFLHTWCTQALRSRIAPICTLARTLRQHHDLLLNWLRARDAFSHGAVEGMNGKARVTTKMAYGFRSYEHAEIALHHALGKLPEPDFFTHRFV